MLKTWKEGDFMVVQLDRGRSNAMNGPMINAINDLFQELATDDAVLGVLLTGKERFFSAGLDVIELFNYNKEEIHSFWADFSKMVKTLATFPKPLVASITGHSPAGGCILALCCDYRVMAEGKYRIGLNEVPVGIPANEYIAALYSYWVGQGNAHRFFLEGKLHTVEEAKACGLVEETCPEELVFETAKKQLQKYLSLDQHAWKLSKRVLRKPIHDSFECDPIIDLDGRLEQWWRPSTRAILGAIVDSLTKKK